MAKKKTKKSKKTPKAAITSKKKEKKKSTVAEKKTIDQKKNRINGIIKTLVPAILGIIFGFVSYYFFGTAVPEEGSPGLVYPWYFIMMLVIGITYGIQKYAYTYLNIKVEEFEGKDWFYVEFIAVDLWLFTWTILLN
ncbi:MAG: EMC6-like membrane protein [Methanotrichaceae archaeon]